MEKKRLVGRFDSRRGAHAPGHLREAFGDWVEDGATAETVKIGYDETEVPVTWLFGMLWNCSDVLPGALCAHLDMRGGSYAMAVRRLKGERS